jgi:transposase, IS30 family
MNNKYQHLSQQEREWIFLLYSDKRTQKEIAEALDRNKATISRELKRGGHKAGSRRLQYFPSQAQARADCRAKSSRKLAYIQKIPGLRSYVEDAIHEGWSPDQISGSLKKHPVLSYVNRESIYQYVYSREGVQKRLGWRLRQPRLLRCRKQGRRPRKISIANRVDISLRPPAIATRQEFGHWEGDTMFFMGHKQGLATQIERKTRYIIALRMTNKTADARAQAINGAFKPLPEGTAKTFTFDNGTEFAEHGQISAATGADVYFTEPYSAWQKGSIENANGLIRWYLPRMTDLNKLEAWKLDGIIALLNNRPRKCLNYRTPADMYAEEILKLPPKVALPS